MNLQDLKLAVRNLRKDRVYTLLNVVGLAVAIAAFLLIIHYVQFERSYEKIYKKADNIYRVTLNLYKDNTYVTTDCETHPPLAPLLKAQLPEVKDYVRVQRIEQCEVSTAQQKAFLETGIYAVDPSMFSIFNRKFIAGDSSKALKGPMDAVLTASAARKYFGDADPVGQTLKLLGRTVTVSGVVEDLPGNTHLKYNLLVTLRFLEAGGYDLSSWNGNNNFTYLEMQPGTDLAAFNARLAAICKTVPRLKTNVYSAEPIRDIHLYSRKTFEPEVNGDAKTVKFLEIVAFLVLLVGIINYVNLTTARSGERMKESSIKKILGATRWTLILQFLTEALIVNFLAFLLALLLVQLSLPFYASLVGKAATAGIFTSPSFWLICGGLFVLNALLSGVYPAYALSSTQALSALSRSFTGNRQGGGLRKMLVVGQFTVASVVLIASLIVYRQLSFMRRQSLGMDINQVLVLRTPDLQNDSTSVAAFRNDLQQLAGISKVSVAGCVPGLGLDNLSTTSSVTRMGDTRNSSYNYYVYGIDTSFVKTLDMEMAAGSNFTGPANYMNAVIINEEASKRLGFSSPDAAIGQRLNFYGEHPVVVGVIKNFHQRGLKEALLPMIHYNAGNDGRYFVMKITGQDFRNTLSAMEEKWHARFPVHPFEYFFLNDTFNQQYQADATLGKIVNVFSIFTLFITCLGLMGLTAYNVSRRTREIGIRKVLGSSVGGIVQLLTRDFVKLVIVAIVIATPLAWWAMNTWLQDFAYRVNIPWWAFAVTGLLLVAVAVCTIGLQSIKAATMNPVKSLRND
ncbi:putative ABC transport system permease protein [Chitinophaga terrae (ex Kim and Jung 2007)]|uniref:Putative ABC transport system permease protein n=1 Tax=Chitinophaga terrae (ex Kim and Jung 2007) TaxID=408074 RepID=A0A1H4D2E6_9BACT|nr:ABC transporter permease [Chitinophaga terrae (ex Kim and Jung 2007)]GEP90589.1 ABC transporter permease [Chitinophaga terrae (ex Kim and Jung 2007)]SEA66953.1 putative ABC transport system permease protein [Chitinophaga terrae (ex Kim and Jung 2007)]